jgi:hypothetical protein
LANHYSFHIMDPAWGHVTIKMSGHPPFPAQVILNGHEYVAAQARAAGVGFAKEGNCFTEIADPQRLAQVADALPQPAAIGRLGQVCDRWIYTACLCFGLDLAEQGMSWFRYSYTVYQAEYSRNLLFRSGAQMEDLFDRICDRTRSRLDIPTLRTLFGLRHRPHSSRASGPPAQEIVIENSQYGLTWFRIRFGLLQLKAYTKGEHVLRFEATVHNTRELRCRRSLDNFPEIITRLAGMAERFATTLDCADIGFLPDGMLDDLTLPSRIGATRTGGIDLSKPRMRAALAAALALAAAPHGFTAAEHAAKAATMTGRAGYTSRQASYDLRKLRGKGLPSSPPALAATRSRPKRPAPSPPCSRSATRSSPRSWPASAAPAAAANPHTGPASTATTRPSASACKPSFTTSASPRPLQPPHRQHFVDGRSASS